LDCSIRQPVGGRVWRPTDSYRLVFAEWKAATQLRGAAALQGASRTFMAATNLVLFPVQVFSYLASAASVA
jgi:hypothetical protein